MYLRRRWSTLLDGDDSLGAIRAQFINIQEITTETVGLVMDNLQNIHIQFKALLNATRSLDLSLLAPELSELRDCVIAVPGTYSISEPVIPISRLDHSPDLFNSKNRPRLVQIHGQDGSRRSSLLKGHDDLRRDGRVMLFLELINQLISHDYPDDAKMQHIFTYKITPFSKTADLIQFVDGANTLFSLISDYRDKRGTPVFLEHDLLEAYGVSNVDGLLAIQKLEGLQQTAAETKDTDLREILWMTSPSAAEWVSRSVRFTQSAAVMSMVGYVLGLGDRHPSNLMGHRFTGGVIHIDFSDCFEVGRNRIKFPELVPFRLTRMMIRTFGPIGIEGEFRIGCEQTLKLVRSHRDSITAVLDIFLQEPLDVREDGTEVLIPSSLDEDAMSINDINSVGEPGATADIDSIRSALQRIMGKVTGKDFGEEEVAVETQVSSLVSIATDMYNLAHLYHGWTPLW
jgi:FKBP12-rapamycin complex-associated protein